MSTDTAVEAADPVRALVLLLTGRTARIAELTGPGADRVRQSMLPA